MTSGEAARAQLVTQPIRQPVLTADETYMRYGLAVAVAVGDDTVWTRQVWASPLSLPRYVRPFERRIGAALRRARKVAGAVNATRST